MNRELAAAAALLLLAVPAAAASVVYPDGTSSRLEDAQEITGPATVYAEGGHGRIQLHEGAVLRFLGSTTGDGGGAAENFFLRSGSCDANLGFLARLATPACWVLAEKTEGARVSGRVEAPGKKQVHARLGASSSPARLVLRTEEHGITEAQLLPGQGAAIRVEEDGGIRFRTDFDNEGKDGLARVLLSRPGGKPLDLYVPKATEGAVLPGLAGRWVVVNGLSSWRGAAIQCHSSREDGSDARADLGAGAAVAADTAKGSFAEATVAEIEGAAPLRAFPVAGTGAGKALPLELPFKVLVKDLRPILDQERGRTGVATLWLENQGAARGPLPLEVAFAYPPPRGSDAPFVPVFVALEAPGLPEGGSWFTEVKPEGGVCGAGGGAELMQAEARFVRLLAPAGAESPAATGAVNTRAGPRRGSLLLGGAIEVIEAKCDLAGAKPALSFTIRNGAPPFAGAEDEKDPFDPVGELRVRVRLYRDGQPLDLGAEFDAPRVVGELGGRGTTLSFRIEAPAESLAGAWPVITLSR